jgi:hypothetical protein
LHQGIHKLRLFPPAIPETFVAAFIEAFVEKLPIPIKVSTKAATKSLEFGRHERRLLHSIAEGPILRWKPSV